MPLNNPAIAIAVALALAFVPSGKLCAAAAEDTSDQEVLDRLLVRRPADQAIELGLVWLRSQTRPDGKLGEQWPTALTSLAVMAHLAAGIVPRDGEHSVWLRRAIDAVIADQLPSGYFGEKDGSRMYGHGIATLMLAEALGMDGDPTREERMRASVERAVAVTVNAARVKKAPGHAGGWRYLPTEASSDLSLSGWQLLSLHAAHRIGITVPEQVITDACAYARGLTSDDGRVGYESRGQDNAALRGLGMLCFSIAGNEANPLVDRIAERIAQDPIAFSGKWFFYRAYYDAVGLSRARPDAWTAYRPRFESELTRHQDKEGFWPSPPGGNEGGYGRVYCTSMGVLALAVERHLLPAYQR